MESFEVRNYRAFNNSGEIVIKPVTVIVGKNSSGKSSLIRLFPLIKQTVERRTAEPILWYGDYVDFGDFEHACSKFSNQDTIGISFSTNIISRQYAYFSNDKHNVKQQIPVKVDLEIVKKYFKKIKISFWDQQIEIIADDENFCHIIVNNDEQILSKNKYYMLKGTGSIIPLLIEVKGDNNDFVHQGVASRELFDKCMKYISNENNKSKNEFRYYIPLPVKIGKKEEILEYLKNNNPIKYEKFKVSNKSFLKINNSIIAYYLDEIIRSINESIKNDLNNTKYIKPIRAMVDRYYRIQGINVEEVDSDGSNIPMILNNMSKKELRYFEEWSKEKFGVIFSVSEISGHVSLVIKEEPSGDSNVNLADTGYGYSQMLPIVMLLWKMHISKRMIISETQTIVIEQPELHLHPAFQSKMIDVFVNVINEAKSSGIKINIIFETHSETMVNRIGTLIFEKKIEPQDVNLLVVNKIGQNSEVKSIEFDQNGRLKDWPIDFFSTEVYQ